METVIGFIAGYIAGAQEGKDGVQRLRHSLQEIAGSAEVRRLAAEALTMAEALAKRAASGSGFGSLSGTVGTVTDLLARRAGAIGKGNRAA
jgi:hypothetical protein